MRVGLRSCSVAERSAVSRRPTSWMGTTWILPVGIVIMLTTAISMAFGVDLRLGALSPHPFWIAVLFACLQGGVTAALATTVVVAGIALVFGIAPPLGAEDFYDHGWRVSLDPLLWLAAAVCIGGMRGRHLAALADIEQRAGEAERQRQVIARAFADLKRHCEDLEREQACASSAYGRGVIGAFDRLLSAPSAERPRALASLVEGIVGEAAYAVLELRDQELMEDAGWRTAPSERASVVLSSTAVGELKRRRAALSAHREMDGALLDGAGIAAVPIFDPRDGRLIGAFLLCRCEESSATAALEMLLGVVCRALANVMVGDAAVVSFEKRRRFWRIRGSADDQAPARAGERFDRRASDPYS
jgi:hypothetical protein